MRVKHFQNLKFALNSDQSRSTGKVIFTTGQDKRRFSEFRFTVKNDVLLQFTVMTKVMNEVYFEDNSSYELQLASPPCFQKNSE